MTLQAVGDGLGDAALRYAWHGWPIAPGVPPGRPSVPIDAALPYRGPMSTNDVIRFWHVQPYPILLATGWTIDVLEVPQPRGLALLEKAGQRGPVAVLPNGRWLFFAEAGEWSSDKRPPIEGRYHGTGSWLPLPPTRIGGQPVTWHADPDSADWRLFQPDRLDTAPQPTPPPRPSGRPPSPVIPLRPNQPTPKQTASREPCPRHHTLHVANDQPLFQITYLHAGMT